MDGEGIVLCEWMRGEERLVAWFSRDPPVGHRLIRSAPCWHQTEGLDWGAPRRHGAGACRRRSSWCVGGTPNKNHTSTDQGLVQLAGSDGSHVCRSGRTAGGR